MAGAYCQFCGNRCFVARIVNDRSWHLATCHSGMAHDRKQLGHDHRTAENPVTGTVNLVVTPAIRPTERACNHVACLRGRSGESTRIRAGTLHAAVTRNEDHHDMVLRYHTECLTDLYQLTLPAATADRDLPERPVPRVEHCPDCGGDRLSWGWAPHNTGSTVDGRLRAAEVISRFHLGCDDCSGTLGTLHPDDVAAVLTMIAHRTAAPRVRV